ncbi:MDIS1-interacting receptor like kinase 1-like [Cryptomeria japonica]|uniref:MDIS1-interacting receptor like kinase 1-like n=1 Tax=Cryptomeria japonica TaxID=3369 RepID=UPI0027DA1693|nr:MDIS1-interacting receptor like kinase 1-like [Cryptomeria japonica]
MEAYPVSLVLVVKDNYFRGSIPSEIGNLKHLQMLDLSSNQISGFILNNILYLEAMTLTYKKFNMNVKGIDLSNNHLNGELPSDFGKLKGLQFLNLSNNNISGTIPSTLWEISKLAVLDLSSNGISGNIPLELESLRYLRSLNLSNNHLSGSIPQGV